MKKLLVLLGAALLLCALFLVAAPRAAAQQKATVVEDIIARVNNQIITMSDYQKSLTDLAGEIQQDCQNCTRDKLMDQLHDRQRDLLRDLIDQQLLIERAKDMDINVETDLIKRLDEVRKQNNLASMEDLQKAVESQGIAWEDYKTQLRNHLLTQEVIRHEVGSRMDIGSDEVKQYYQAHQGDFNRPEQVSLSEIFLSTENKSPEDIYAIRTKADDLHNRLVKGDDFSQLAKKYSEGSTAQDGGELGVFEHGQLAPQLEDVVFKLNKGDMTDVIQTKTGFDILKVDDHYQAGLQPLDKVEGEITNKLYMEKMDPALRKYLGELREESYVMVKPGYTDSAAIAGATVIQEVAPTPDTSEKEKVIEEKVERMKKSHFVIDLSDGQAVASLFLVRIKEVRTSARTGSSWLQLELGDRTGSISAKMWDNFEALATTFEQDDIVQVRGRVKLYRGEKELTLEQIIPAAEREYELGDFLPHTPYNIDELFAKLTGAIAAMKNPWLKRLLTDVVEDPAITPRLRRAPAAMTMHHAYVGGLLEHVVSLIGLASGVAAHYAELDGDLLLTGVVLHDIGKLDELRYARGIDYSDEGRLLGHITIGAAMVRDKIKNIAGFPAPLATLVQHLILSHHGSYEFGSPALPQFPEAIALHFIDDLDSKMGGVRATLGEETEGAALWTERNPSLRRFLIRSKQYLAGNPPAPAKKTPDTAEAAAPAQPAQKGLPLRS